MNFISFWDIKLVQMSIFISFNTNILFKLPIFAKRLNNNIMEQILQISQLSGIQHFSSDYSRYSDNYLFSRFTPEASHLDYFSNPMRFNGMIIMLCRQGGITLEINLETVELKRNVLVGIGPDKIVKAITTDWEHLDAYILFVTPDFLKDINIDLNAINLGAIPEHKDRKPMMELADDEADLLCRYLELLHENTKNNTTDIYVKSISRNLVAAIIYQMLQFMAKRRPEDEERPRSRRLNYVRDFMRLVQQYHRKERSVGFYAQKLFISPKYLSLIIKEATGKSAAEWIDDFVILEAKNLLRFSGKNVQQVAYELNFSNQSSFGKYFKHLTGMSPTEFQKA